MMIKPRKILRGMICAGALVLLFQGCGVIRSSPAYYYPADDIILRDPIMSSEGYDSVHAVFTRPYIVYIEGGRAVLTFGAEHTKDPNHPQFAKIDSLWTLFNPDAALVEGRLGFIMKGFMNPVSAHGESAYVQELAKKKGIELYSWDPPVEADVKNTLKYFHKKKAALFYVLRPYFSNYRFGKPDDPESFVLDYLEKRTKYPGLEGSLSGIAEIDSLWKADFAGLPDWRETSDAYGWPGYLNDIARISNTFRDEHLVQCIAELTNKGKRVFAIMGSSHAVKTEKALRVVLE